MPLYPPQTIRVLSVSRPNASEINDTTSDQDYAAIYTIPASLITTNKVLRVTLTWSVTGGTSSVTTGLYLKLGSTKVYAGATTQVISDGVTRGFMTELLIIGTAAPGASVSVECNCNTAQPSSGANNTITQPVGSIATNGTLTIVPGVVFSGTGSTETMTLLSAVVEELN